MSSKPRVKSIPEQRITPRMRLITQQAARAFVSRVRSEFLMAFVLPPETAAIPLIGQAAIPQLDQSDKGTVQIGPRINDLGVRKETMHIKFGGIEWLVDEGGTYWDISGDF